MTVRVIENTTQKTYEWLAELAEYAHFQNSEQAYSVLRIILHSLRDRLPLDISSRFAAQLPMLLTGVYYNGWEPNKMVRDKAVDDFINEVSAAEKNLNVNAKDSVENTLAFIKMKLDPSIIDKVINSFPDKTNDLWQIRDYEKAA